MHLFSLCYGSILVQTGLFSRGIKKGLREDVSIKTNCNPWENVHKYILTYSSKCRIFNVCLLLMEELYIYIYIYIYMKVNVGQNPPESRKAE